MTARSHGLDEFIKPLETTLRESEEYDHEKIFQEAEKFVGRETQRPKALLPLRPVFIANDGTMQTPWPMVNQRAKEAERAAQMFRRKKQDLFEGNDDVFFDAKDFHASNQKVANILSSDPGAQTDDKKDGQIQPEEATLGDVDDAWGDDDIALDNDIGADDLTADPSLDPAGESKAEDLDDGFFVPPSAGADPLKQALKKNPQNVGLHIANGEFTKALELLKKQLGINTYSSLKQAFVDIHSLSKLKLQTMPHMAPMDYQLRFLDQPLNVMGLQTLTQMFSKGIELFSKGDFSGSLLAFRQCL